MIIKAEDLLDNLVLATQPPQGCAITIIERKPDEIWKFNWLAGSGLMDRTALARYETAVAELKRHHPKIDWDGITTLDGEWRRLGRYLSEVEAR
jgi:hypothetical protein